MFYVALEIFSLDSPDYLYPIGWDRARTLKQAKAYVQAIPHKKLKRDQLITIREDDELVECYLFRRGKIIQATDRDLPLEAPSLTEELGRQNSYWQHADSAVTMLNVADLLGFYRKIRLPLQREIIGALILRNSLRKDVMDLYESTIRIESGDLWKYNSIARNLVNKYDNDTFEYALSDYLRGLSLYKAGEIGIATIAQLGDLIDTFSHGSFAAFRKIIRRHIPDAAVMARVFTENQIPRE